MLANCFQIFLNILYVCQSVSWLTFLLKLDKYREISSSGGYIFLNFFGGIPGMLVHQIQILVIFLVCLSVCQLAHNLNDIRQIQGYLQFWMIYMNQIFGNIPGMLVHQIKIILNFLYVCQSVSWLTSLLKFDKYSDISSHTEPEYRRKVKKN